MKILLFGKNGQIGQELRKILPTFGDLIALGRDPAGGLCGDLERLDELRLTIDRVCPQVIVNAAAFTSVDEAQINPALAHLVNATAVGVMANRAKALQALFVQLSTDYVYSGEGNAAHCESDTARPVNVYGESKLEGEREVLNSRCDHLILRTSWVHSDRRSNFVLEAVRRLQAEGSLPEPFNQCGSPTSAALVARAVHVALLNRKTPINKSSGVFNFAAKGYVTRRECMQYITTLVDRAAARVNGPQEVRLPDATSPSTRAARPVNCRLSTDRFQRAFNYDPPHWQDGVRQTVAALLERLRRTKSIE